MNTEITNSDNNTLIAACMLTAMQYDKGELKKVHPQEAEKYRLLESKLRSICYDNNQMLIAVSPLQKPLPDIVRENEELKAINAELLEAAKLVMPILENPENANEYLFRKDILKEAIAKATK